MPRHTNHAVQHLQKETLRQHASATNKKPTINPRRELRSSTSDQPSAFTSLPPIFPQQQCPKPSQPYNNASPHHHLTPSKATISVTYAGPNTLPPTRQSNYPAATSSAKSASSPGHKAANPTDDTTPVQPAAPSCFPQAFILSWPQRSGGGRAFGRTFPRILVGGM